MTSPAVHAGVEPVIVVRAEGLGSVAAVAMVAAVVGSERSEPSELVIGASRSWERVGHGSESSLMRYNLAFLITSSW
jgi:hypothetical protein